MRTHADKLGWLMKLSEHEQINSNQFKIAFCLISRLNLKTGQCCPSMGDIAKQSGYGARAIQKAVRHMESVGVLKVDRTTGGKQENTSTFIFTGGKKKPILTPVQTEQLPDGLNQGAWIGYLQYRREAGHKKLTATGMKLKIQWLIGYPIDVQQDIVNQSISQGYQGLFEVKNEISRGNGKDRNEQSGDIYREMYEDALAREHGASDMGKVQDSFSGQVDEADRYESAGNTGADSGLAGGTGRINPGADSPRMACVGGEGSGIPPGQYAISDSLQERASEGDVPGISEPTEATTKQRSSKQCH